jgi:hypothetical protein
VWARKAKSGPVPEVSAPLDPLDWGDGHSVRFGNDPTSSAFGGRTFDAGEGSRVTRAPSEYWNPGPSPDNMTNIVTGRPGKVTAMPAEDQAGAIPDPADLPVPAIAVPDTGGAALRNLGHHAGGCWGQPMEDAGGSLRDFGQAGNNVLSTGGDLLTGDPDGSLNGVEGIGSGPGDSGKNAVNTVTDLFQ